MKDFVPAYLETLEHGRLQSKIDKLYHILDSCHLCPRMCQVNRRQGESGYCRVQDQLLISSYGPHFGEESPLVGSESGLWSLADCGGSGTIFVAGCNLLCVFCQNYEISHLVRGEATPPDRLSKIMLYLQERGCHNINFVSPTHVAPQLVEAVKIAAESGLKLPIVWNCGGYENVEIVKILDGVVDIYMPDFKFSDDKPAQEYCVAADYFARCCEAVQEMHRQVGDLKIDKQGIACRGLLIRHLVMPNDISGSEKLLTFIAKEISKNTYVNIMSQYRPCGRACNHQAISRRPTRDEYLKTIDIAVKLGLERGIKR